MGVMVKFKQPASKLVFVLYWPADWPGTKSLPPAGTVPEKISVPEQPEPEYTLIVSEMIAPLFTEKGWPAIGELGVTESAHTCPKSTSNTESSRTNINAILTCP